MFHLKEIINTIVSNYLIPLAGLKLPACNLLHPYSDVSNYLIPLAGLKRGGS